MAARRLGCVALVTLVSCSGSRETPIVALDSSSATTPVAPISSESVAATATPSINAPSASAVTSAAPVSSAQASPPAAYPEEWIRRARGDNSALSCFELVYKNGCSETRTGSITFQVTIDDNGAVVQFSEVNNQIRHDKAVVSRCLGKNLPRWKFHAPEGHEKTFQVLVAFSDKC